MPFYRTALLICLALAACAVTPPPDTATVPFAAFGTMDNDVAAANLAGWAFADPARTANDPVDGARAVAAVDFLAGELSSNPRWVMMSPFTKQDMLQARSELRQLLGIVANTPSQVVTNALLQFADQWQADRRRVALQILTAPGFTQPPEQTLRVLSNLPFNRAANIAGMNASNQVFPGGEFGRAGR